MIRRWLERDRASMEYAHVVVRAEVDRATKEPGNGQLVELQQRVIVRKLTTSFDNLMSTHSAVNSQRSRKSTLIASARASASSADRISKRRTRSPPYLASSWEGGLLLEADGLALADFSRSFVGILQMLWMILSLTRESEYLSLRVFSVRA
jgi:hypothetical protein